MPADMHACMIEGLDVQEGERVLDIGSGCGVTSAILAYLVRSPHLSPLPSGPLPELHSP